MKAFRALLVVLLATQVVLLTAAPAAAQVAASIPCPPGIPSAGFLDVQPSNIHKHDIDCIKYWKITTQPAYYDPLGVVTREQMALFLTRAYHINGMLPLGNPRGFLDIAQLSAESQIAIQQLGELSITTGVSATAYDPYAPVTREQMALFLARTVRASLVDLPDGSSQGFADIGGLPAASQQAINQMRQLGITAGTSPTTFDPAATVTRQQMASFLARTLNVIWRFEISGEFILSCNTPLELNLPGTVCTGSGSWPQGLAFRILEGYFVYLPGSPSAVSSDSFSLTLDGAVVPLREKTATLDGIYLRVWEATFPTGLTGNHTITGQWFSAGVLATTITLNVNFSL